MESLPLKETDAASIRSNDAGKHHVPNNHPEPHTEKQDLLDRLPWLSDPRVWIYLAVALIYMICAMIEFLRTGTHTMLDQTLLTLGSAAGLNLLAPSRSQGRKGRHP